MENETIKNILIFLKEKEGKKLPQGWFKLLTTEEIIQELENKPDDVQYIHKGGISLMNSNIKKLPNDLHVRGYLNLNNCKQLKELPTNLRVDGHLWLEDTDITKLPDDLYVAGLLNVRNSKLIETPFHLYVVSTLILSYNKELIKISDKTHVGYDLDLRGCIKLRELPNDLFVGHDLYIQETPLAEKYTDDEIYGIIENNGGQIRGKIFR